MGIPKKLHGPWVGTPALSEIRGGGKLGRESWVLTRWGCLQKEARGTTDGSSPVRLPGGRQGQIDGEGWLGGQLISGC